jgi:hypothetical protein
MKSTQVRFLEDTCKTTKSHLSLTTRGLLLNECPIAYSRILIRVAELGLEVEFNEDTNTISWDTDIDVEDADTQRRIPTQECPICYELLNESMAGLCGHSVCVGCLKKMTTQWCPICRSDSFQWIVKFVSKK